MKISVFTRLRLGLGKLRRFYLHTLNRDYVRRNLARRRGDCRRCGTCCRLMFNCPFLKEDANLASCIRHDTRWQNCRIFPVDELDLAERDRVSLNGPCGYYFDPPHRSKGLRWLGLLLACAGALLQRASRAGPPREPTEGGAIAPAVEAAFRGRRMPALARAASGRWELAETGIECVERGELAVALRRDGLGVRHPAARVELWGELRPGREPLLPDREVRFSLRCGGREGGVRVSEQGAEVYARLQEAKVQRTFPDLAAFTTTDAVRSSATAAGKFRLVVRFGDDAVSASAFGARASVREVFRDEHGSEPVRELLIAATPGQVVHGVKVSLASERKRPQLLSSGDSAFLAARHAEAAELYRAGALDTGLGASERAEAAFKHAVALESAMGQLGTVEAEMVRSLELAISLDPLGPWGERSRSALARMALARGDAHTALGMAHELARCARGRLDDWGLFEELVSGARAALAPSGRATAALRRIAERLEWAGAPPERVGRAWEELALALEARSWRAEADAVRSRAERLFGTTARRAVRARQAPISEGAPGVLPEPEKYRLQRERSRGGKGTIRQSRSAR